MAQKRKLPFLLRILLPPVLALAVLWGGSFCANALLDSQGGPKAKELLLQTGEEIRSANQLLFEKKTYQIICDYSIAFLEPCHCLLVFAQLLYWRFLGHDTEYAPQCPN